MKKKMGIALLVLAVGFASFQLVVASNTNNTKQYAYKVEKKIGKVEIRNYEEAIFAKVTMNKSDFRSMSSNGFRVLADYIFGNNESSEKIAMTSPVLMEMSDTHTMEFMMPTDYDTASLPVPNNSKIEINTRPEWKAASIKFGGWANDEIIENKINELKAVLKEQGIEHNGKFKYLGYNPPYQMVNRRNEVVVEVN